MSSGFETAATMLGGSAALGYIVIGLLAFVLGVCVTILCFRIRLLNKEEQTEEQKGDNADGTCRVTFVQFSVTLLGFCLSGIRYLKSRKAGVFPADLLLWLLCARLPVLDAVSAFVLKNAAGFLCVGVWLGGKRYFSFYFAILPLLCGGKRLCVPKGADCLPDRRSAYVYFTAPLGIFFRICFGAA